MSDTIVQFKEKNRTLADQYESAMYKDTHGLLMDLFCLVSNEDSWWLNGIWEEIKKHEDADDSHIGFLLRLYVELKIKNIAQLQQDGVRVDGFPIPLR